MFFLHGTLFHALNEWQNGIVHAEKSGFRFRNFLRGTIQIFCHIAGGESLVQHCFDAVIFRIYTLFLKLVENVFPFVGDDLHVFRNVAVSDVDEVLEQAVVQYFIFHFVENSTVFFQLAQRTISLVAFVGGYQRVADQCPYIALCGFRKLLLQHLSGS